MIAAGVLHHPKKRWLAIWFYFSVMTLMTGGSTTTTTTTTTTRMPVPYPESFSITFQTNITSDLVDGDDDIYPVWGKLYYDWARRSQRIDHAPGSYECQHFYHTPHSCSLLFVKNKGMYRITHSNSANGRPCCLDLPNVGAPSPNWASDANPTFDGVVHDAYSGQLAYQWTFDHLNSSVHLSSWDPNSASSYHTVRQLATGDDDDNNNNNNNSKKFAPLLFTFPGKANGRQDFHYQIETLQIGLEDPSIFRIPDGCETVVCDKTTNRQTTLK